MTDTPNTVQPLRSDRGPGMTHTRRQATMTHELLVRRLASTTTALTRSSLQDRSGHAVATQPVTCTHRAHRNPRVSKCALRLGDRLPIPTSEVQDPTARCTRSTIRC